MVLAYAIPMLCLAAPLTQFASLLGYHAYLKMRYLLPMRYGSAALILSMALALIGLLGSLLEEKPRRRKKRSRQTVFLCYNSFCLKCGMPRRCRRLSMEPKHRQ